MREQFEDAIQSPFAFARGKGDVLAYGKGREDSAPLRHQAHPQLRGAVRFHLRDVGIPENYFSITRRRESNDRVNRRRFAHAIATQQRHDLAVLHFKRNALQDVATAIISMDVG